MNIAYNLTAQDFVNFQEYYIKKKAPIARYMQPVIIATLLCNILIGAWLYFYQGLSTYTYVCLICVLLLGILLIGRGQTKKKMLKAALRMEKDKPGAFGKMTMDFNEKGIDIHSSVNQKFLTWEEVDKHDSNKNYFFIYSKKGMVYIVPKRDIQIPESEFIATLDKYLIKD